MRKAQVGQIIFWQRSDHLKAQKLNGKTESRTRFYSLSEDFTSDSVLFRNFLSFSRSLGHILSRNISLCVSLCLCAFLFLTFAFSPNNVLLLLIHLQVHHCLHCAILCSIKNLFLIVAHLWCKCHQYFFAWGFLSLLYKRGTLFVLVVLDIHLGLIDIT